MTSDNFIVHIYRRSQPDGLIGQVEDVDSGRKQPFQSMDGLWRILVQDEGSELPCISEKQPQGGRSQS